MRVRVLCSLFVFSMIFFISCGKDEVKKRETFESERAKEAFALAERVRQAFVENDIEALRKNSTEEGLKDIIGSGGKRYDSVDLNFSPRWLEIQNNKIFLNVAWKSSWTAGGRSLEERGMAVFVMEGAILKISQILRANPFDYPGD